MSEKQTPFVVATTDPIHTTPSPVLGRSPVHSPTSPTSPIIITAHLDGHLQQQNVVTTTASAPSGHRRSASDASQRRQKFAESPQDSVVLQDSLNSVNSSHASSSVSQPPTTATTTVSANVSSSVSAAVGSCQDKQSAMSTNGHVTSVPVTAGDTVGNVGGNSSRSASPFEELHGVEMRRKQRPLRQAQSDVPISMTLLEQQRCSQSLSDAKEHAYTRLMKELGKAQRELRLRDEECEKLSMLRTQMEHEIDELSAALFEEANKMVQDAHVRRMNVEKRLEDANHQIEILQSEVSALKHLVVTSTPSTPNKHLHPQISEVSPKKEKSSQPFWRSHRRSTSHHQFTKEARAQAEEAQKDSSKLKEMDTTCFDEFQRWKLQPSLRSSGSPFLSRVLMEDIQPCLNFRNKQLAERVLQCVQQNSLTIEPIPGDSSFPRKCSLSDMHKLCNYKIKLEEDGDWHSISQLCRNRIAAVCDFYTYIRYICQGLVKSSDKDMFHEIVKLRLQMATARLGC
ncbi:guanine nucleotide exchange factor for Rab-3A-like [Babylonia areolata]|uniref:guanine nucleotide exchange factor for Rab-3A-like n=1 Tax=Babylonia areolata TaxID=304850 RepID=UPI003FD108B9